MTIETCTSPASVTPQWLGSVLQKGGCKGTVSSFSAENIGTGQVGQNVRFSLEYSDGEGPSSVVGKFASDDPVSRQTGMALGEYLKEVLYYQQLDPGLAITTPEIYHSHIELDQPDEFVLLMEDLAPGRQGDQLAGCDADTAHLALTELTGLAGPMWCDPSLQALDWLAPPEISGASVPELWSMLFPGFIERYGDSMTQDHVELAKKLSQRFTDYQNLASEKFTLVHVDYRLDNMIFDGPYPMAVVDWAPALGSGAADAAYFMGTGMDNEPRMADERPLMAEYHQRLLSYGIDNYSFEECWRDYRYSSFAGLIMAVIASMVVTQTDRGDAMFMAMARRSADMALSLDALDLIR